MSLPSKLKIGGHTFSVIREEAGKLVAESNDGLLDTKTNTIYVNKSISQSQAEVTLIHEALHAMNSELNHTVLESLAQQIYAFLKDNKLHF